MSRRPRVLVVDDSAFARKVMREVLSADARVEFVGIARDGLEALEKIQELSPDVVTLDMVMPGLDGLGVIEAAGRLAAPPSFVIVTSVGESSDLVLRALELGAVDFVQKPTSLATDRLYELGGELAAKVRAAFDARGARPAPERSPVLRSATRTRSGAVPEIILIGASTGGPRAVYEVVEALPTDFPVPIAVVLHMPIGYVESFAARLAERAGRRVRCAEDGLLFGAREVAVAPAGRHLHVLRHPEGWVARLTPGGSALHQPSVDELFMSGARAFGPHALGVVLTGMGDDGVLGARALRESGGTVWTESAATAVVYGMPRAVVEAGESDAVLDLDRMPLALASLTATS